MIRLGARLNMRIGTKVAITVGVGALLVVGMIINQQFGNAVVVPVVEAVARHIAPWIGVGEDTGIRQLRLRLG